MKLYALDQYHDGLVDLIISFVFAGLATLAVVLRCWARRIRGTALWIDDLFIIVALVILWALVGDQVADGKLGIRTHTWELPTENLETMLKLLFSGPLLYSVCLLFGKSSYVFFYRRIFVTKSFKVASLVVQGVIVAWFIGNVLQVFLICRPLASNWDSSIEPSCGPRPVVYATMGSINVVTDAALMILPVPYIRQLHINTSSKVGVSLTFLFGLVICAASVARTIEVYSLDYTDPSYELLTTNLWSTIEPALLIANSCIPLLRGPLQIIFSRFWSRTRSARSRIYPIRSSNMGSRTAHGNSAAKTLKSSSRWSHRVKASAGGSILPISQSRIIYEEDMEDSGLAKDGAGAACDALAQTVITATGDNRESDIELGDLGKDAIRVRQDWYVGNEESLKPSLENISMP